MDLNLIKMHDFMDKHKWKPKCEIVYENGFEYGEIKHIFKCSCGCYALYVNNFFDHIGPLYSNEFKNALAFHLKGKDRQDFLFTAMIKKRNPCPWIHDLPENKWQYDNTKRGEWKVYRHNSSKTF